MSDMDILKIIGGAVAGGGVALCGRIIFDWLKIRNGTLAGPTTEDTHNHFDLDKCDRKHKAIDDWKSGVDVCLVQHKGMLKNHEKRLDKGSKDFEGIKKDIAGLNTSYAVLASKVK